jgi:subtilase family serine protease
MQKAHSGARLLLSFTAAVLCAGTVSAAQEMTSPGIVALSRDRGATHGEEQMTLTVNLALHDQAAYEAAIAERYRPESASYHHWFSDADFAAYGPSAEELAIVEQELRAYGLQVLFVSADNASLRARGSVANVEQAFHTQIHDYERDGVMFHANATPARLGGAATNLVSSVAGLSNFRMRANYALPLNPKTGSAKRYTAAQVAQSGLSTLYTNKCFESSAPVYLTTEGASVPRGTYVGNLYDDNSQNAVCGWMPEQVQAYYGVQTAIKAGYDGKGQTIVIVDGPSDASVRADLVTFAKATGLPGISSSNFQVIYPDGAPTSYYLANVADWDLETDLDIEWAHSIAPGAKIVLLITPTNDWSEFQYAIQYAVEHKLGHVISNSYGYPELAWGKVTLEAFDAVLKKAAAAGIAVNFSSGDHGDNGTGSPSTGGDQYPAASAYATSVGGTAIAVPTESGGTTSVGWGNNDGLLSNALDAIEDPPFAYGFLGGSGGGESIFIAKPSWQSSLPGKGREQPDLALMADPYTGGVVYSQGLWQSIGGTSLACPIFSAMWTLADEKAGTALGQAAPILHRLPAGAISDVVPVGSKTNVAGTIEDSNGSTHYSGSLLLGPLDSTTTYFSALWDVSFGEYLVLSFGTDTSLKVTTGWDNVTGWGTPNGVKFLEAAAATK